MYTGLNSDLPSVSMWTTRPKSSMINSWTDYHPPYIEESCWKWEVYTKKLWPKIDGDRRLAPHADGRWYVIRRFVRTPTYRKFDAREWRFGGVEGRIRRVLRRLVHELLVAWIGRLRRQQHEHGAEGVHHALQHFRFNVCRGMTFDKYHGDAKSHEDTSVFCQ